MSSAKSQSAARTARPILDRSGNPLPTGYGKDDWSFHQASTSELTHGMHVYPARLMPQVARKAIDLYSEPGDTVLDPFCGSGTVLVEARANARNAVGADLNPLAVLIAKVKATPLDTTRLHEHARYLLRAVEHTSRRGISVSESLGYWFKASVVQDLERIWRVIESNYPDLGDPYGDFFRVVFSATLRQVSNNRSGDYKRYRLAHKDLKKHNPDPIAVFAKAMESSEAGMQAFARLANPNQETRVAKADARHHIHQPPADLVVTSPPYGDSKTTVAYGQFSSFSIEWMGLKAGSPLAVDRLLMGAPGASGSAEDHSKTLSKILEKIGKNSGGRREDVLSFFNDFEKSLSATGRSLKKGGRAVFITGNRAVNRIEVPMDVILSELAERWFETDASHFRIIGFKRIPKTVRQGSKQPVPTMAKETVTILTRR